VCVPRVPRDPPRLNGGVASENQRELGFRERRGAGHDADVAHRCVATERDVKERRSDSAGEQPALDWSAARVRDVEDRFVDQRLRGQPRRGENELLVRVLVAVDSRKNGGSAVVESLVGMEPHHQGADDVRALVRENAGGESKREMPPIVIRV